MVAKALPGVVPAQHQVSQTVLVLIVDGKERITAKCLAFAMPHICAVNASAAQGPQGVALAAGVPYLGHVCDKFSALHPGCCFHTHTPKVLQQLFMRSADKGRLLLYGTSTLRLPLTTTQ